MVRLKLLPTIAFRDELRSEYRFIKRDNLKAAEQVRNRIISAMQRLRDFPQSGRAWRIPGKWELVIAGLPYIVVYMIENDQVVILSLFHTSREIPHAE